MTQLRSLKLQAVKRRRLAGEIAGQIERLILNGEIEVGDMLPPERKLAAQLEVSRHVLREAISLLAQKGLLEVRHGLGTYVARPGVEFLQDSIDTFLQLNESALLDLTEARLILEVEIAGLAARRATEEDCRLIDDCLAELETAIGTLQPYVEADLNFHTAIAGAAKNQTLQLLLGSIRGALSRTINVLVQHRPPSVDEAMHYHRLIARAIEQHDGDAARESMRQHLGGVRRGLEELEPAGIARLREQP